MKEKYGGKERNEWKKNVKIEKKYLYGRYRKRKWRYQSRNSKKKKQKQNERKMTEKKMIADRKRTKWRYNTEELAAILTNNIKQVNKM